MRSTRLWFVVVLTVGVVAAIAAALSPQPAQAGGVVGPPCDDAAFTARLGGGGLVTFNCGGPKTISIFSVKAITQSTSIDGGGQIRLTGGLFTRLFTVANGVTLTLRNIILDSFFASGSDGGAISSNGTLVLENTTIQYSKTDINHSGAAFFSTGPVIITHSLFLSNTGGSAGAIFIYLGNARAQVTNSTFEGNQALNGSIGRGGAIWVGPDANLSVVDSQFVSNTSKFIGGALFVSQGGTATVTTQNLLSRTAFIGNVVTSSVLSLIAGSGGAIFSQGGLSVNNVAFFRNETGVGFGGAISANAGSLDVSASDFDGNRAFQVGGALNIEVQASIRSSQFSRNSAQDGGAIYKVYTASLSIGDSTFDSNHASLAGGGLAFIGQAPVTLTNVTVHGNSAESGGGIISSSALRLSNSAVLSNTSGLDGGGIHVNGGGVIAMTNVTLSGNAAVGNGGGMYNDITGTATLTNSTVSGNSATDGGGIYNANIATLNNSTLSANRATNAGGGMLNKVTATLNNSTLSGNSASNFGGGIENIPGEINLNNVTINGNSAGAGGGIDNGGTATLNNSRLSGNLAASGGGIFNDGIGTLTLDNSTLSGNMAGSGGGLYNTGPATLSNSTVSGNSAVGDGGGILNISIATLNNSTLSANTAFDGGGLWEGDTTTLNNSTLSGNNAQHEGGGIFDSGKLMLRNVSVSNNAAAQGGALFIFTGRTAALTNTILAYSPAGGNCGGDSITSSKFTFSSDSTCALVGNIKGLNPNGLDPLLDGLGNYGGPTLVHMPKANSPAVDGIVGSDAPGSDQRGQPRPVDGNGDANIAYDIGAVERQPSDVDVIPRLRLPLVKR